MRGTCAVRRALPVILLLFAVGSPAALAQASVTLDAGYAVLQNKVLLAAAYGAPAGWTVGALARVMFAPSVDVSGQTGIQGYVMSNAVDAAFLATAGFSFATFQGLFLSPAVYAGTWIFGSEESLAAPSQGIAMHDNRTLAAFRAGVRVDARWIIVPSAGLGVVVGADLPWQLLKFSALGLAEASTLLDISAGITWRIPAGH